MSRIHTWPNGSRTKPFQTSGFGWRTSPITGARTFHYGCDLVGFPINKSSARGVVTFARYNGAGGNEVRVHHPDDTETRYKHNKSFLVSAGQAVVAKQDVGVQGTTGASTGVHCHFECRLGPSLPAMNPDEFMSTHLAPASGTAGGDVTPIERHDQMVTILKTPNGKSYRGGEFSCFEIPPEQAQAESAGGGRTVPVTDAELKLIAAGADQANNKLIDEIIAKLPVVQGMTEADRAAIISGAGDAARAAIADALSNG